MKTLLITVSVIVVTLLVPACRPAAPSNTSEKPKDAAWTPPTTDAKDGGGDVAPEPARSIANHAAEWIEIGLTEEQIRAKITDGIENKHLGGATAITDDEKEMLKKAGATDEMLAWLATLDLPEKGADPPKEEGEKPEGGAPAVEGEKPEGDAPPIEGEKPEGGAPPKAE